MKMAKAQDQLSFAEMMQQLAELNAKIAEQGDARVAEIKSELELIATAKGKSIAELLGIETKPASVAATGATRTYTRRNNSNSEETDEDRKKREIKERFAGQVILNPGVGKDYTVGSRGAFPVWVMEAYDDLLAGKLDAMPRDEYLARGNEEAKPEEQPAD